MQVEILHGDVRDVLPTLAADSFDCIVTSPPYWGLRDYGCSGQIGLEPTLAEYLATMTAIMRECRRVLRPAGTCWLNIGDSYAANRGYQVPQTKGGAKHGPAMACGGRPMKAADFGMKPKDLCMVPNRLAIMLQEDGWYVRSEIIWHKPNPMPESVTDRPTSAHEKVWLLTKSERYFFDADAIREQGAAPREFRAETRGDGSDCDVKGRAGRQAKGPSGFGAFGTRNARNVWTIAPKPFRGAHFATMPPDLAERCVKAGCPVGGLVLDPFGGAGTTGLVASRLGRDAVLIELNPAYSKIARSRINGDAPLSTGDAT